MKIRWVWLILLGFANIFAVDAKLKEKAKQGDAKAQFDLSGQLIWSGEGDVEEAKMWCKKSADGGYWEAQLQYGNELIDQKDFTNGKKYLLKAATQGSVDAINNLGYTERGSTGAPPDFTEALKWYRIGEILTNEESANVQFVKKQMSQTQIDYAEIEANKWVKAHPKWKRK